MGYAISLILAWLLQDQLQLPADQLAAVQEVTRFIVYVYSIAWFKSPFVSESANVDLEMFKALDTYAK